MATFDFWIGSVLAARNYQKITDFEPQATAVVLRLDKLLFISGWARRGVQCKRFCLKSTVVFRSNRQSRVTHPPVDSEIWQGSRVTLAIVESPQRHTGLKIGCKVQKKAKILFQCRKFRWCHAKFWLLSKCRIGFLGHASHPVSI
jgi:hypothetical protein